MRPDTITLAIEEKYSAEEKAQIAQQLACAVADAAQIANEKKDSDKAFNARISEAETKFNDLVPEVGKKSFFRKDTEALVETRDMSPEERQEDLQFPTEPKKPKTNGKTPEPPKEPEVKPAEITFRYIQDIAATIVTLPQADQTKAVKEHGRKNRTITF